MYNRTQNENGSYNTRCLDCFMTIAYNLAAEEDLEQAEIRHICPEKVLAQIMVQQKLAEHTAARN